MTGNDKQKYVHTILLLLEKLGGSIRGKKKLAKLLYFVDFDFYEKYENSITGDVYKHLPMGPFPIHLEEITSQLRDNGQISIAQEPWSPEHQPYEVYRACAKPDLTIFSSEELAMIGRVAVIYGGLTGTQLEKLSHEEAPYVGTKPSEEIPYELSLYRGTDFSALKYGA